jgi:putative spermidine/putrescine transport system substrate-binding protein
MISRDAYGARPYWTRRKLLAGAAATLALPAIVTGARAANEQIVLASYGGTTETFMRNEAIPSFEKETGIKVVYFVGTALSNYSRVLATKRRPEIDVYWANDLSHLAGKLQDLYAKLDPSLVPNLQNIYPLARDADGIGVASNLSGCGLQYNPRKFKEAGFAPPTSWLDLWDPKFKGRVAVYSIGVLFSQDFLAMMSRVLGGNENDVRPAITKIRELRDSGNIVAFANSPAEMDNIMVQEQAWINYNAQTRALALIKGWLGAEIRPAERGGYSLYRAVRRCKRLPKSDSRAEVHQSHAAGGHPDRLRRGDRLCAGQHEGQGSGRVRGSHAQQ